MVEGLEKNPLARSEVSASQKDSTFEICLLEKTLSKITSLVQIGFGEAGSEIIAGNIAEGKFDPMVQGKKVYAVFGFCDIRCFTEATECLKEEVSAKFC